MSLNALFIGLSYVIATLILWASLASIIGSRRFSYKPLLLSGTAFFLLSVGAYIMTSYNAFHWEEPVILLLPMLFWPISAVLLWIYAKRYNGTQTLRNKGITFRELLFFTKR
jgi:hypothetical protein